MSGNPRRFGVPTSLPGPYGIGDIGPAACRFVDDPSEVGVRRWQVLPLRPATYGNSPYRSPSTFAGDGAPGSSARTPMVTGGSSRSRGSPGGRLLYANSGPNFTSRAGGTPGGRAARPTGLG
ncbi:MAG: 4-alpha-glucanotransferase [Armatimonadia bacterium]